MKKINITTEKCKKIYWNSIKTKFSLPFHSKSGQQNNPDGSKYGGDPATERIMKSKSGGKNWTIVDARSLEQGNLVPRNDNADEIFA